jgi:hypothetical protein
MIGEWVALPVLRGAGGTSVTDPVAAQIMHPRTRTWPSRRNAGFRCTTGSRRAGRYRVRMIEFAGRWELVAAADEEFPETRYDDGDLVIGDVRLPIDEFNRRWLAGEVFTQEPPLTPRSGLTLTIAEDGTFTETGAAEVSWFDDEGVLEADARPFDGTLATSPAGTFLLGEQGLQAVVFKDATDLRLRIDDGDTGITDLITVEGDGLLRVMSVITDEMSPCRVRLAYRRA